MAVVAVDNGQPRIGPRRRTVHVEVGANGIGRDVIAAPHHAISGWIRHLDAHVRGVAVARAFEVKLHIHRVQIPLPLMRGSESFAAVEVEGLCIVVGIHPLRQPKTPALRHRPRAIALSAFVELSDAGVNGVANAVSVLVLQAVSVAIDIRQFRVCARAVVHQRRGVVVARTDVRAPQGTARLHKFVAGGQT